MFLSFNEVDAKFLKLFGWISRFIERFTSMNCFFQINILTAVCIIIGGYEAYLHLKTQALFYQLRAVALLVVKVFLVYKVEIMASIAEEKFERGSRSENPNILRGDRYRMICWFYVACSTGILIFTWLIWGKYPNRDLGLEQQAMVLKGLSWEILASIIILTMFYLSAGTPLRRREDPHHRGDRPPIHIPG